MPTRMYPSLRMMTSLTVPPVELLYTNAVSNVPSVLNRLRFPVNDPPTTTFPSACTATVSAPVGSAAAVAFVLKEVSSTPVAENFFTLPVNEPTT